MNKLKSICVYCGSSAGTDPLFKTAARDLGRAIAEDDIRLVYGGGTVGLMGALSESARENGAKVTGIIPEFLMRQEATEDALARLDELHIVEDMHIRKRMMFEKSDAFVALPGGIGTLEELVEMMTWVQIGQHEKPIVLANIGNYWSPLLELLDHMIEKQFLPESYIGAPIVVKKAEEIIPAITKRLAAK